MKNQFIKDIKEGEQVESCFMVMKKLNEDGNNIVASNPHKTSKYINIKICKYANMQI